MSAFPYNRAVMEQRTEAPDSLDFFPTPPWATRALFEHLGDDWQAHTCWDGCAGEGHMAEVLREFFQFVHASDVHDYGRNYTLGSFIGVGPDVAIWPYASRADWLIMNPPFNVSEEFVIRALTEAAIGVAILQRSNWLATQGRYTNVFSVKPPSRVLQFTDRVPMVKGRWDPTASTATEYSWFVWELAAMWSPLSNQLPHASTYWIAPGAPIRCSRPDDIARFAGMSKRSKRPTETDQYDFWGI